MKITVTATYITIGETTYPLNSLFFKSDGIIISIFIVGVPGAFIKDIFSNFRDSNGGTFNSADEVMALLETSIVTP